MEDANDHEDGFRPWRRGIECDFDLKTDIGMNRQITKPEDDAKAMPPPPFPPPVLLEQEIESLRRCLQVCMVEFRSIVKTDPG